MEYPTEFEMLLHSLISILSTLPSKKLPRVSASFWSSEIVGLFSIRVILVKLGGLLERKRVTDFQNVFLCVISVILISE